MHATGNDTDGYSGENSYSFTPNQNSHSKSRNHIFASKRITASSKTVSDLMDDSHRMTHVSYGSISQLSHLSVISTGDMNDANNLNNNISINDVSSERTRQKQRTNSLVGTLAYMAPEIKIKCSKEKVCNLDTYVYLLLYIMYSIYIIGYEWIYRCSRLVVIRCYDV